MRSVVRVFVVITPGSIGYDGKGKGIYGDFPVAERRRNAWPDGMRGAGVSGLWFERYPAGNGGQDGTYRAAYNQL